MSDIPLPSSLISAPFGWIDLTSTQRPAELDQVLALLIETHQDFSEIPSESDELDYTCVISCSPSHRVVALLTFDRISQYVSRKSPALNWCHVS
jgi:hypothetical protein